jgi:tryptophan synthase alpha chain
MAKIVKASRGFIYYVSMTGITGSKLTLDPSFAGHLAKLRGMTPTPVCIGFGIATPDDARSMAAAADGVIVGSALVRRFHEAPETAREFVAGLRAAI